MVAVSATHWNERYRQGEHASDPPLDFIARLLPAGERRQALDIACGAGRHSVLMAERGWLVTAVDWSEAALALVRARDARIHTVLADLEAGGFPVEPKRWDLICISYFLDRSLLSAIGTGLAVGGLLAAALPLVDQREGIRPMRREFLLEPGELRALFDGFEILHYCESEPAVPKRRGVELLARRL